MPRFDIPGRPGTIITLWPQGSRRDFRLPYDTEDPAEIKLLRTHKELTEVKPPKRSVLPPKPSKEVTST